jgi:hypothetical protein
MKSVLGSKKWSLVSVVFVRIKIVPFKFYYNGFIYFEQICLNCVHIDFIFIYVDQISLIILFLRLFRKTGSKTKLTKKKENRNILSTLSAFTKGLFAELC